MYYTITRILTILLLIISTGVSANEDQWSYSKKVDEFTDSSLHKAILRVDEGYLEARCNDKKELDVIISVNKFISTKDCTESRYRFDKNPPIQTRWCPSTKGTSVFANKIEAQELVFQMIDSDVFQVEISDYNGTKYRKAFSTKKSSTPLNEVIKACGINNDYTKGFLEPTEKELSKISEDVIKYVARLGRNNVSCSKMNLTALGYKTNNLYSNKGLDFYQKLQAYLDSKVKSLCGFFGSNPSECKKTERFLSNMSMEASKVDNSITSNCGHFYISE